MHIYFYTAKAKIHFVYETFYIPEIEKLNLLCNAHLFTKLITNSYLE